VMLVLESGEGGGRVEGFVVRRDGGEVGIVHQLCVSTIQASGSK
jgi:hypothetical protein